MKTIRFLKVELAALLKDLEHEQSRILTLKSPAEIASLKERIPFVQLCITYMKHDVKESYLQSELDRIQARVKIIARQTKSLPTAERAEVENGYNVAGLKKQIETLQYLLT